jgi:hypothetical protein
MERLHLASNSALEEFELYGNWPLERPQDQHFGCEVVKAWKYSATHIDSTGNRASNVHFICKAAYETSQLPT